MAIVSGTGEYQTHMEWGLGNMCIGLGNSSSDSDSEGEVVTEVGTNIFAPIQKINYDLKNNNNFLRVGHLNARSVPKHIFEIRRIAKKCDFDIIGVSETFIKEHTPLDRCNIDNYTLYKLNRTHTTQGGVGIFVKNNIKTRVIETPVEITNNKNAPEVLGIVVTINRIQIAIITVYRTPKLPYTSLGYISDYITDICCRYEHNIILGDFNINQLDTTSPQFKYFRENITEPLSLTQIVNKSTRITQKTNTLIDLILTSFPENCRGSGATEVSGISDHHMVYMNYAVAKPKIEKKMVTRRNLRNFCKENFLTDCENTPWNRINIFAEEDVENKATLLEEMFGKLIDKHAPMVTFIEKHKQDNWINKKIEKSWDKRDKLKTKWNRSGKDEDKKIFKEYRNKVSHMVRRAQKKYYNQEINNCIKNPSQFYNNIKKNGIVENKKHKSECRHSATYINQIFLQNNNGVVNDDKVNEEIRSVLQNSGNHENQFTFREVSSLEVKKIIKSLKSNSSGHDNITSFFVKLAIDHITNPLVNIINSSLLHRKFPENWKRAIVKPIPKIPNAVLPTDFRPISLLTTFSKICEKAATYQMIYFLEQNNKRDKNQSAYRSNHSTTTALLNISDDIYDALDDSELTILVLLDYSKAFDTINHRLLFAKLKSLGFASSAISWICSYLTDRKQKVKTSRDESGWETIKNGVPQGSILGPLLFTIMVYDIQQCIKNGKYHMYADDTQIYYKLHLNQIHDTIKRINEDISRVTKYSENNCLKINAKKSFCIFIGSKHTLKQVHHTDPLLINNQPIKRVRNVKNLGVYFDEHFTWEYHIKEVIKGAFFKLKQFYRLKNFLTSETKQRLVEVYVLSKLNYCNTITQGITQELKRKLQLLQNACIRYIYNVKKYDHITPYIKKLKTLNIESRTKYHGLSLMHKIIKGLAPSYLSERLVFRENIHTHNTRNQNLIHLKRLKKAVKNGAFFHKTANDYNHLLQNKIIKKDMTVATFKKHCYKHLLSKQNEGT